MVEIARFKHKSFKLDIIFCIESMATRLLIEQFVRCYNR